MANTMGVCRPDTVGPAPRPGGISNGLSARFAAMTKGENAGAQQQAKRARLEIESGYFTIRHFSRTPALMGDPFTFTFTGKANSYQFNLNVARFA
jgi:hypothetical protein